MFSFILIALSAANTVSADPSIIYVNDSGGNDVWNGQAAVWDGLSTGPKKSIKSGIKVVSDGGTVNIANGNYTGVNNTNIVIDKNIIIQGQSREGTIINGTNSARIFTVQNGLTVTIQNLTFVNGSTAEYGAAIRNNGTLSVNGCIFKGNKAWWGGGIYNEATLNVDGCIFADSTSDQPGSAIHNDENTVSVIKNSIFVNNANSAILNNYNLTITNCTFTNNEGAILNQYPSTLIISNSTFNNNSAGCGGAIKNSGTCNITGSTFKGNIAGFFGGGAIYNMDGYLNIYSSTFADNSANPGNGGAIWTFGNTFLNGCIFTGNTGREKAGAIYNMGMGNLTIINSNFTVNSVIYDTVFINNTFIYNYGFGGAIYNDGGNLFVRSSRMAGNTPQAIYNNGGRVDADLIPPTATADIKTGLYNTNKIITLSISEPGTIYYTLNGVTPTTASAVYTGPITISSTTTLKFIAVDNMDNPSTVYTEVYTIDKTPPKVSTTSPKNGATKVSRTAKIAIKLSENIKASVNWSKIVVKNSYGKAVKISNWISGNTLYIKTNTKLNSYSYYTVYIPKSALKDYVGNNFTGYTFRFKTGKY